MDFVPAAAPLAAFTLAAVVLAASPGPDMALFVGRTLANGRRAGLAALAGALTGLLAHAGLAALGLSALLAASPALFAALKAGGALYLAWLAVLAIRRGSAFQAEAAPDDGERALLADWLAGLGVNLLNAKVVLFFVVFLPGFVSADDPAAAGKLFFLGLHYFAVAAPILFGMLLVADRLAAALKRRPDVMRAVDYASGTVFAAFAAAMLLTPSS